MMSSNFQKFFDRATRIVERALGNYSKQCIVVLLYGTCTFTI
jgi:hypothetical protein